MEGLQGISFAFSSAQLLHRVELCDPMDCSTPGFPSFKGKLHLLQIYFTILKNYSQFVLLTSVKVLKKVKKKKHLQIKWTDRRQFRANQNYIFLGKTKVNEKPFNMHDFLTGQKNAFVRNEPKEDLHIFAAKILKYCFKTKRTEST